ncbi:MAG TPA: ABC transporter ATP-binding protein [Thermodesulfobacteriota bacterium]|nr:ABC transporter ATP-binding protein [Thermodesulfobacteriota bacterium]
MTAALAVHDLTKDFGGLRALDGVTLEVRTGERVAILGPNGAGKTTLFNLVTGLLRPSRGRIALLGRDVTTLPAHRRARLGLSRTFQVTTLFPNLTVLDSLLLALRAADRSRGAGRGLRAEAEALLADWQLAGREGTLTRQLSYGEQRQLELALALATRPRVLLLDEPTAGLSPAETRAVTGMLERLPREITVLLIEHDMDVAFAVAERIVVLAQGRLLAEGPPEAVRASRAVAEIYLGSADA